MQPEQPQYETPPINTPVPQKKSIRLPLLLMVGPVGLLILAILGYGVLNLLMPDQSTDGSLFTEPAPVKLVMNIILFLLGSAVVLLGPISFIIGLVLLIQRKSKHTNAQN